MTWIKLDDRAIDHPKIAQLSYRAFWWWIKGLSYASAYLTDGALPPTFFRNVPKTVRAELTGAGLWEFHDPDLQIHDYLGHQQSRERVEAERRRNRDRRNPDRGTTGRRTAGTTTGNTSGSAEKKPPPESREQIQRTENREEKEQELPPRGPALVMSPAEFERRRKFCAFVGSKIEVPNGLHAELRKHHGGANPESELQAWYLELNEQAENEAWRIPVEREKFYPWFKGLYGAKFPTAATTTSSALSARLQAIERGEVKR